MKIGIVIDCGAIDEAKRMELCASIDFQSIAERAFGGAYRDPALPGVPGRKSRIVTVMPGVVRREIEAVVGMTTRLEPANARAATLNVEPIGWVVYEGTPEEIEATL